MGKHLTLDDRSTIASKLNNQETFAAIAADLNRDCSTISREVRNHRSFQKTGALGKAYNACALRFDCNRQHICTSCPRPGTRTFCWTCRHCNKHCPDFVEEKCRKLSLPPYVCNGCTQLKKCTLEKCFYSPNLAQKEYKEVLSESRQGLSLNEQELCRLDGIISPLIIKGQSIHHICVNNKDSIMISESSIYRLIDYNAFTARNIDLPRKVRFAKRKAKKQLKLDKDCRNGRTYKDYLEFIAQNPSLPVTQMDSVEGKKGGKVLLTLHFVKAEFMIAFLRDANDAQSVIDILERLYLEMRPDVFMNVMPVLLADNGAEFSNPTRIEFDKQNNRRTHLFYCDPSSPEQKGSAERNHELIRYCIPKGTSLDDYTQGMISYMMDNINSLTRKSLGDKCPYDVMEFLYGQKILDILDCHKIPANDVVLTPSVFAGFRKKEDEVK